MEFMKFTSLDNTYNGKIVSKIPYEGKDGGLWMASEKLHGANFSFWCDGNEVKVASRTQFVDGTFFNCQAVINRHAADILAYHEKYLMRGMILVIYGELYGANIQKEVQYGERRFSAFDIRLDGEVVHKQTAVKMAELMGIKWAPILKYGTFEECMAVGNHFRSLESPEDASEDNFGEGTVIEPVVPQFFNNGSRIYLKNKTEAFIEKKNRTHKMPSTEPEFSEEVSDIFSAVMMYATEARVRNVLSKIGNVVPKDFGRVLGLMIADMLDDHEKEMEVDAKHVAGDVWKQFHKRITSEVAPIVRPVFLDALE